MSNSSNLDQKEQLRTIPISLPVTGEDEWQATREPIMSGWLTAGPKVREFEEAFVKLIDKIAVPNILRDAYGQQGPSRSRSHRSNIGKRNRQGFVAE